MASLKFLVSYNGENELITVKNISEIISACAERFQIPSMEKIKFQRYEPEWGESVNVTVEDLKDRDKLTLSVFGQTLPVMISLGSSSSLSSENLLEERDLLNLGSSCSDDLDSFDEVKDLLQTGNLEEAPSDQQVASISGHESQVSSLTKSQVEVSLKPWPDTFPMPSDALPHSLLTALKAGNFPDDRQRKQLVQAIFDKMCEYTRCPTKENYTQVARTLVKTYPILAQSGLAMGNSFDYWKTKISDKFRNERKHMAQPTRKKLKLTPGGHSVTMKTTLPEGEDEESIKMHEKWMVDEMKKKKPLDSRVRELMDLTFASRRKKILEERVLVKELKLLYPCLFTPYEIQKEFQRITGLSVTTITKSITKYTEAILRHKYTKDLAQLVNNVCARDSDNVTQGQKVALALYLLPNIFRTKKSDSSRVFVLQYEMSQDVNMGVEPVIVVEGDVLEVASYRVVCEKEDIVTTQQLTDAFCCLVSSFYCFDMKYPENEKEFYKFEEVVLLNMDMKPTRQIRSVLAKLV